LKTFRYPERITKGSKPLITGKKTKTEISFQISRKGPYLRKEDSIKCHRRINRGEEGEKGKKLPSIVVFSWQSANWTENENQNTLNSPRQPSEN